MYIHRMIRTQLYIEEEIHARLRELARQQGKTISELVRDALVRVYGANDDGKRRKSLHAVEGLWRNRKDIGSSDAYVRRLRGDTHRMRKSR